MTKNSSFEDLFQAQKLGNPNKNGLKLKNRNEYFQRRSHERAFQQNPATTLGGIVQSQSELQNFHKLAITSNRQQQLSPLIASQSMPILTIQNIINNHKQQNQPQRQPLQGALRPQKKQPLKNWIDSVCSTDLRPELPRRTSHIPSRQSIQEAQLSRDN